MNKKKKIIQPKESFPVTNIEKAHLELFSLQNRVSALQQDLSEFLALSDLDVAKWSRDNPDTGRVLWQTASALNLNMDRVEGMMTKWLESHNN